LVEDDTYLSYHLPKNTTVMANVWEISRDPSVYPSPEEFKPERFMDETEEEEIGCKDSLMKDGIHAFGHGRRVCPGTNLAMNTISSAVLTILWALDFEAADPESIDPDAFTDEGLIARCPNFTCKFSWRDEAARELACAGLDA